MRYNNSFFLMRHHAHHYLGFARTQWGLFLKESPRRVKPLLYVFRVLLTGIHLMHTSEIEANLLTLNRTYHLPYLPELIERKISGTEHGTLPDSDISFYEAEYLRLVRELETARDQTHLPEHPTSKPALHDLLLRIRGI